MCHCETLLVAFRARVCSTSSLKDRLGILFFPANRSSAMSKFPICNVLSNPSDLSKNLHCACVCAVSPLGNGHSLSFSFVEECRIRSVSDRQITSFLALPMVRRARTLSVLGRALPSLGEQIFSRIFILFRTDRLILPRCRIWNVL